MDAQSYDFLHRVTNWIFKSKAGMTFEKSIININVNFDNEDGSIRRPPRKNRKDNLMANVQPSVEAQRTSFEIQKRVQEIQTFRKESQSAIEAPLLVTALVRKTHQRLDTIEVSLFVDIYTDDTIAKHNPVIFCLTRLLTTTCNFCWIPKQQFIKRQCIVQALRVLVRADSRTKPCHSNRGSANPTRRSVFKYRRSIHSRNLEGDGGGGGGSQTCCPP